MSSQVLDHLRLYSLKHFSLETLVVKSKALKGNPLGDSPTKYNPIAIPREGRETLPVVLVLAGFAGNGTNYMAPKTFESNFVQMLDQCYGKNQAPHALYVFVDAMTFWGGSQFINSKGTGNYQDYIVQELLPAVSKQYDVYDDRVCVMGGSSGGYGALHLASQFPDKFPWAGVIAPDSFFEASLQPEIYTALPLIKKSGGVKGVVKELKAGKFLRGKDSFTTLNAIGMGMCYAPHPRNKGEVEWPVDENTGVLKPAIWKKWKKHDPIEFLEKRATKLKRIERIYLDVGNRDQYHLQYGSRQIQKIFKRHKVAHDYSEFDGNHSDISSRRPQFWSWLKQQWNHLDE